MLNRRRCLQQLGLAGCTPSLPAAAAASSQARPPPAGPGAHQHARLRLGVVALPGSALAQLAQRCAWRLTQRLGDAVALQVLAPGSDAMAWCSGDAQRMGLLLAEAWCLGAQPSWHSDNPAATACLAAAAPLAVLAREPLVLAANRFMPKTLVEFRAMASGGAADWRYGVDGTHAVAVELVARCLQQAGLGRLRALEFRGPSQLLPALAGARLQLTVQRIAGDGAACSAAQQPLAGKPGSWAAAQQAGDVQLLAVADAVRLAALPELPTLNEALGGTDHIAACCQVLLATPGHWPQRLTDAVASLAESC